MAYIDSLEAERAKKDVTFGLDKHSPLHKDSIATFTRLNYFPVNKQYRVQAKIKKKLGPVFKMLTSSGKEKEYRQYGIAKFRLKGKCIKLPVYQSIRLLKNPLYRNYLFVPFTDLTNGEETYGGGRYIETEIPEGKQLTLDFNACFNPYCHYSDRFNCPVPPRENFINLRIEAGEQLLYLVH